MDFSWLPEVVERELEVKRVKVEASQKCTRGLASLNSKARPDFTKDKRRRGLTSPLRGGQAELELYGG